MSAQTKNQVWNQMIKQVELANSGEDFMFDYGMPSDRDFKPDVIGQVLEVETETSVIVAYDGLKCWVTPSYDRGTFICTKALSM